MVMIFGLKNLILINFKYKGRYLNYFEMMAKSIQQRNFEVKVDVDNNFTLILYYQIGKGFTLKEDFELRKPLIYEEPSEFLQIYRLFLFDVFKAKDQERIKIESTLKPQRIQTQTQPVRSQRVTQSRQTHKNKDDDDDDDEEFTIGKPSKMRKIES